MKNDIRQDDIRQDDTMERQTPELQESFLLDAWDVLTQLEDALGNLAETPEVALSKLRLLAHRLQGTAALYGHTQMAKLGELLESVLSVAPALPQQDMHLLHALLEQAQVCLTDTLEHISQTGKEGDLGLKFSALGGVELFKALLSQHPQLFIREQTATKAAIVHEQPQDLVSLLRRSYQAHQDDWEFFAPEAQEHLYAIDQALHLQDQDDAVTTLFRATHTLKGAAYMVGVDPLGDLAHELEEVMVQVRDGERDFDEEVKKALQTGHRALELMLKSATGQDTALVEVMAQVETQLDTLLGRTREVEDGADAAETASTPSELATTLRTFHNEQADVWEYFAPETREHLLTLETFLESSPDQDPDEATLGELYRAMHTVKGAAYMVDLKPLGDVAKLLEAQITEVRENDLPFAEIREVLAQGADVLTLMLRTAEGEELGVDDALAALNAAAGVAVEESVELVKADTKTLEPTLKVRPQGTVRVRLDKLEDLMNLASDIVTVRSRLSQELTRLSSVVALLETSRSRMLRTVSEFETQYMNPQLSMQKSDAAADAVSETERGLRASLEETFDELEFDTYNDLNILARTVAEMANDLGEVESQLGGVSKTFMDENAQLETLSRALRREVGRARMVPVGNLFGRLSRLLKDSQERTYSLRLSGESVEIDTMILEGLVDPLVHMVRNSVVHGIEPREERLKVGKSAEGKVFLRAFHQGNNLYLEVEDDGAGIDTEAVKRKALEKGLISPAALDKMDETEAQRLIFLPGLSTAEAVTTIAGRGVGMDAVLNSIEGLRGEVSVESEPGVGTRFTLKLPLTLLVAEALLVRVGSERLAIPANTVETLRYLPAAAFETQEDETFVHFDDRRLPYFDLPDLLGLGEPLSGDERPVVLLKSGTSSLALGVHELHDLQEVVVRGLDSLLAPLSHLAGTTIDAAGQVILMLDPAGLSRLADVEHSAQTARLTPTAAPQKRRLLLADDSISVRRVISKMLARAGYEVTTAMDGQEALGLIVKGAQFDAILTDLEMPHLNGFELIEEVRRRSQVAIMVMTTRAGDKHRKLAFELGANDYLSKPVDEAKLLRALTQALSGNASSISSAVSDVPLGTELGGA